MCSAVNVGSVGQPRATIRTVNDTLLGVGVCESVRAFSLSLIIAKVKNYCFRGCHKFASCAQSTI